MCDLEERFRKCIEKYDISKDQLTYSWKGQNEDVVNKLFTDWNTELKEVLQDKSKSTEEKSKELKNIISKTGKAATGAASHAAEPEKATKVEGKRRATGLRRATKARASI